jgi:hypothetical protein
MQLKENGTGRNIAKSPQRIRTDDAQSHLEMAFASPDPFDWTNLGWNH